MNDSNRITLKAARASHPLAPAVLRQLGGGWEAIQSAIDAANHGADGGFPGFVYYTETEAFTKRNRAKIAGCLAEMARDFGTSTFDLVRSFRCLEGDEYTDEHLGAALFTGKERPTKDASSDDADAVLLIRNALAWFALEEVGHAIVRLTED